VIFRREPIHKKLAREAELRDEPETSTEEVPGTHGMWSVTGIHGVPRPRRWDAVASAEAPGLAGDELHFVTLPNGDLVVDEDEPEGTIAPLADSIEQTIEPPYRAEAVRQQEDVWAVAARRVRVAAFEADGNELELVASDAGRMLSVDGERAFGSVGELEEIGRGEGEHYVVRARRLDDHLWEVEADPL
jgi:hypothetical protein